MRQYREIRHPDTVENAATNRKEPANRTATIHIGESILTWLYAHKRISAPQVQAGNALQRDFLLAGLMPNVTMHWGDPAAMSSTARSAPIPVDLNPARLDARRRFDAALDHVGPGLADICWRTICAGESIGDAERNLSWPARSGRLVLTLALDRLVQYYRIPVDR